MKYYKLDDAVKAAVLRTRGTKNTLYIYPCPSVNGLFVDWMLEGIKYSNKTPSVIVTGGKAKYPRFEG